MLIVDFDGTVVGSYEDEELAFGRRNAGVVTPYSSPEPVDCGRLVAEAEDDALMLLPQGWQHFTPVEAKAWVVEQRERLDRGLPARRYPVAWDMQSPDELTSALTIESARRGNVQKPGLPSGQGSPKGEWDDPEPIRPARRGCPCCYSTYIVENDHYERGWECGECGYGSIDSHENLDWLGWDVGRFKTDAEVIGDRPPGHRWFTGSRPGSTAMYRNEDLAAGRVIYHDDSPVMPEESAVAWDSFPYSWDIPDDHSGIYGQGRDKPRLDREAIHADMWERVNAVVAAWQALGSKGEGGGPPSPEDGEFVAEWWCGEFQMWAAILCTSDGDLVCVECDNWINGFGDTHPDTCPGLEVEVRGSFTAADQD